MSRRYSTINANAAGWYWLIFILAAGLIANMRIALRQDEQPNLYYLGASIFAAAFATIIVRAMRRTEK